jgi:hypothetical protein
MPMRMRCVTRTRLVADTLKWMFSPMIVVFLSGPEPLPLSSPNLHHVSHHHVHHTPRIAVPLTWPSASSPQRCARPAESASSA